MNNQAPYPFSPNNQPSGENYGFNPPSNTLPVSPSCPPQPTNPFSPPNTIQPPISFMPAESSPIEKETEKPRGLLMVILVFFSSLFFSDMLLRGGFWGLAVPVCITLFYILAFWYLKGRKHAFSRNSIIMLFPIGLLSCSYLFDTGVLAWFVTSVTLLFLIPAQLTVMSGVSLQTMFSSRIIPETIKTAIGKTICNMHTPFRSFRVLKTFGSKSKKLMMGFIGLICAIPFLLIFTALFSKADAAFSYYIAHLFSILDINISALIFDLFFGSIIAIIIASFFFVLRGSISEQATANTRTGKLNIISTSVFLFFILLLQGLFIITQITFLFGENPLPSGMSYGEYVHTGFFQIAAASILTALIILCISLFGKRAENGCLPNITKILLTILTLFDFFLYFCAYVRMYHYINAYDLSVKRIGVCWLMALMGLILAGTAFKMWFPKINLAGWIIVCTCIMVISLNIINPDRLTAKYNVDEYLAAPQNSHLDINYLSTLSTSAALELDRLKNTDAENEALRELKYIWHRMERRSWKNATVMDGKIREVLNRWDINENNADWDYDTYMINESTY